MNKYFEGGGYAEKPKTPLPEREKGDICAWVLDVVSDAPERGAKIIRVGDNTYWEEGRVSPEVMKLIENTEAVQATFKELREKRGDMGESDVRHMIRVTELIRTAIDMGVITVPPEDRRDLLVAALCHDKGKAEEKVRRVLGKNKGKKLSSEDRKIMQEHVRSGAHFLELYGEDRVARIVLYHHENNGEGENYPRSGGDRRKEYIPVEIDLREKTRRERDPEIEKLGNFLGIVDKIESTGSKDRPYNKNRKALDLLRGMQEKFSRFASPEEISLSGILEKIDPNNLQQRAKEEMIFEEAVARHTKDSQGYTPS